MRRRPVEIKMTVLYLAVAFLAAGALGAVQPVTRIPAEVVQLTQFGPALGVGIVALLWPGRVRELFAGGRSVRVRGALLLVTAPLITIVAAAGYAAVTGEVRLMRPAAPFVLVAVAQLIGACGEEIGWRCLLQPLLRPRFGRLGASMVVGVVWGVWHVQVFAQHPLYAASFLLAAVSMSVVLGWALDGAGGSRLLLAGGFHALINLGMLLAMDEESGAVLPMVLFGSSCLVAAVWWVRAAGPGRGSAAQSSTPAPTRLPSIMRDVR
ncbi:CPBP family intramembrane glutamic endopeptidase [Streptomyces spirodelae]|nr:CPBP family intramembrane glutamic endopeptidase [Streptomyces spirodelae]